MIWPSSYSAGKSKTTSLMRSADQRTNANHWWGSIRFTSTRLFLHTRKQTPASLVGLKNRMRLQSHWMKHIAKTSIGPKTWPKARDGFPSLSILKPHALKERDTSLEYFQTNVICRSLLHLNSSVVWRSVKDGPITLRPTLTCGLPLSGK